MRIKESQKSMINNLNREVALLRSFIIGIAGKDKEGEYQPEFVKKILKVSQEKATGLFSNPQDLIKLLDQKK